MSRCQSLDKTYNRKNLWPLFCLLTMAVSGSASVLAQSATTKAATAKPFSASFSYTTSDPALSYGVPLVQVRLDSNVTAMFALDTGTNPSFISDALAKKLALKPAKYEPLGKPFLDFGGKPARFVTAPRFDISDLHIIDQPLLIIENKTLSFAFQSPIDGIIGIDILRRMTVLFDFPHHHIVASYPGWTAGDLANTPFKDVAAIPLSLAPVTTIFCAQVELQDGTSEATVDLRLDTGAGFTSIPVKAARQLKLFSVQKYSSTSANGAVEINKAFVSSFRLGTVTYQNQQVTYPVQDATKFPESLGMDFFNNHLVLMDFPQKKMYILAP